MFVKCPYCGHENEITRARHYTELMMCDVDHGGCDQNFAYRVTLTIEDFGETATETFTVQTSSLSEPLR